MEAMSRVLNLEFSEGLICKTIREVGIACDPIVKELVEELQKEDQVHLDETAETLIHGLCQAFVKRGWL